MSDSQPAPGTIGWCDLTTGMADQLRDFYQRVVGWQPQPVDMGGYADFTMIGPSGTAVAGICHARGPNAHLPPTWLIYIVVADLGESLRRCLEGGGTVLSPAQGGPAGRYAVITDPSGAAVALFEPPASAAASA